MDAGRSESGIGGSAGAGAGDPDQGQREKDSKKRKAFSLFPGAAFLFVKSVSFFLVIRTGRRVILEYPHYTEYPIYMGYSGLFEHFRLYAIISPPASFRAVVAAPRASDPVSIPAIPPVGTGANYKACLSLSFQRFLPL